ncbi:MAG TPA: toll/interleukin-1 receptor domain-containing protein [Armatimonadota bacterium]|nr:toll/interleukin-1 receptor domain-containing protein [Armatimonadota bacterium]
MRAGEGWQKRVDGALERCTHFVALLSDEYWVKSNQCLRELYRAVERFEAGKTEPRLLFVLANEMKPELLKLDGARHGVRGHERSGGVVDRDDLDTSRQRGETQAHRV